jgi:hypothetical protein
MISDETWDRVREHWASSVPEAYRPRAARQGPFVGEGHGAIILPMPPDAVLSRWLDLLAGRRHLRSEQRALERKIPARGSGKKKPKRRPEGDSVLMAA